MSKFILVKAIPAQRRRVVRIRRTDLGRYLFVLPAVLFMLGFFAYPVIDNIGISLQDVGARAFITGYAPFVGLSNYATVLQNPSFQAAVRNTIIFTIFSLIVQFIVGMALALFFNRSFPLAQTLRSLILLPWLLPLLVTGTTFKWMFTDPNGIINYALVNVLHILPHGVAWLADTQLALPIVILANIWIGIPFNMIILHSGLQGIPLEIYEAAAMDGASPWDRYWRITLPLLRPVISLLFVLGFIYTIKVFEIVVVLTQGGPADATQVFSFLSYQLSFQEFLFGQGAAVGNIMVLIALACGMGYLMTIRREQSWT